MEENYLVTCADLINKIGTNFHIFTNLNDFTDLAELGQSLTNANLILTSYNLNYVNNQDFIFLTKQIKNTLSSYYDIITKTKLHIHVINEWSKKINLQLIEIDYLINLQLKQLVFIFPPDKNSNDLKNNLSNKSANIFWTQNFGNDALIIPSNLFLDKITTEPTKRNIISHFLDFTQDEHISIYEFEIISSIFGFSDEKSEYFSNLISVYINNLFHGFISACKAETLLSGERPGTFIIRISKSDPHNLAVSFIIDINTIKHCLIYSNMGEFTLKVPSTVYKNLEDFISAHKDKLIYPMKAIINLISDNNLNENLNQIKSEYNNNSKLSISESDENLNISSDLSINPCLLCYSKQREILFMNCKHLLCCNSCSEKLKKCPICREIIVEKIKIFVC